MILPLNSDGATLPAAGGKGKNLARLVRAGFNVPPGFIITTAAYRSFVAANGLRPIISAHLTGLAASETDALQHASAAIREQFASGSVPDALAAELRHAYGALGQPDRAVAVRSSATAEDLADLSFAGQQDTFLNVVGQKAFVQAVVNCWSSLWTARAIGYRLRNGIDQETIALAVVVQEMVNSDVSGVLFTANPLSGLRSQMVIDATWGLGEALVSGQVEPDQYVLQAEDGRILHKSIGSKALAIRGQLEGGTLVEKTEMPGRQALGDTTIGELATLGRRIEALFASPQDVEWAVLDGRIWLLQSRPITSLYPLIDGIEPDSQPVRAAFSFGAVQGMLDPMTPLGRDTIRTVFAGAAELFDYHVTAETQKVLYTAGERLFGNFSTLIRHPIGRRLLIRFASFIEPGAARIMVELVEDERFHTAKKWLKMSTLKRAGKFALPVLSRYPRTLRHPDRERIRFQLGAEELVTEFAQRLLQVDSLSQRVHLSEEAIRSMFPYMLPRFIPLIGVAMASLAILNRFARQAGWDNALAVTRGLPHNVTTQMDLVLWETAVAIRGDDPSRALFQTENASILAKRYLEGQLPPVAQAAVAGFMRRYGMRGVGEIDLGRPRWHENPTQLLQVLRGYLNIEDPAMAPAAVFYRSRQEAETTVRQLQDRVSQKPLGRLRARIVRASARRVRTLSGLRETPKFTIIRVFDLIRQSLLQSGQQLVEAGVLRQADDLMFLRFSELSRLAGGEQEDWQARIAERRLALGKEKGRRRVPLLLLSDGQAFYGGTAGVGQPSAGTLQGSPVSPGKVEGPVRVVLDPQGVTLKPGEILVCPATDPAWTPLFLSAGGLVMEVGGLMTHGSVVAREYGIPAVVGVFQATTRLHDGQMIVVDGSSGKITLLE